MFISLIRHSRLGFYVAAIKSSEEAAAAAGVRVALVKVTVFCLSAAFTALGGVVYVFYIGFADPNFLSGLTLSIQIALTAVVGGTGYLVGPIVGAIFYEALDAAANAAFGAAGGWDVMILGFSVVAIVLTEPRGLCEMAVRLARAIADRVQSATA
jgi:branched-chain amino acid transport system permease protein